MWLYATSVYSKGYRYNMNKKVIVNNQLDVHKSGLGRVINIYWFSNKFEIYQFISK